MNPADMIIEEMTHKTSKAALFIPSGCRDLVKTLAAIIEPRACTFKRNFVSKRTQVGKTISPPCARQFVVYVTLMIGAAPSFLDLHGRANYFAGINRDFWHL